MTMPHHIRQYEIMAFWGPREEAPEAIADRYIWMVETLARIDPVFTPWFFVGIRKTLPFDQARAKLPALIAEYVGRDWVPAQGHRFAGKNSRKFTPRSIGIMGRAGNRLPEIGYSYNTVNLETAPSYICPTDASIVTYDLFRAAMVAIIQAWDVEWCMAYPTDLMDFWPRVTEDKRLRLAWMTYISPYFASLIPPPQGIESQIGTRGGVLMVATRERFDVANPEHMEAARAIDAAIAPLNAMPWPPEFS
jgi:hypothetical protein